MALHFLSIYKVTLNLACKLPQGPQVSHIHCLCRIMTIIYIHTHAEHICRLSTKRPTALCLLPPYPQPMFAVQIQNGAPSATLDVKVVPLQYPVYKSLDIHICLEQSFVPPNVRFLPGGSVSTCDSCLDHEVVCVGCITRQIRAPSTNPSGVVTKVAHLIGTSFFHLFELVPIV